MPAPEAIVSTSDMRPMILKYTRRRLYSRQTAWINSEKALRVQHDLAEHLALLHVLVGSADFVQRERMVDDGLEPSGEDVAEHFVEFAHRAHIRPQQCQLAREQKPQVEFHLRSGSRTAGDERASGLERPDTLLPGGMSDVLDDDIDAFEVGDLADFLRNLLLIVIDDKIGAEFAGALHFALVARGSDHARVK